MKRALHLGSLVQTRKWSYIKIIVNRTIIIKMIWVVCNRHVGERFSPSFLEKYITLCNEQFDLYFYLYGSAYNWCVWLLYRVLLVKFNSPFSGMKYYLDVEKYFGVAIVAPPVNHILLTILGGSGLPRYSLPGY